jgi:hypothetical protein
VEKARRTGEALLARADRMLRERSLPAIRGHDLQIVGTESVYGPHAQGHASPSRRLPSSKPRALPALSRS